MGGDGEKGKTFLCAEQKNAYNKYTSWDQAGTWSVRKGSDADWLPLT